MVETMRWKQGSLVLLDQTLLPQNRMDYLRGLQARKSGD